MTYLIDLLVGLLGIKRIPVFWKSLVTNGQPYVVGASAERHGTLTRKTGASRYSYTVKYYGVFAAAMLARLMNVILSEDGQHYARNDINGGRALVIDIGDHTTDWLAVNPGGAVDYSLAESTSIGIQEIVASFERSFRANSREAVRNVASSPLDRVREARSNTVRCVPCGQCSWQLNRVCKSAADYLPKTIIIRWRSFVSPIEVSRNGFSYVRLPEWFIYLTMTASAPQNHNDSQFSV